MQQTYTWKCGAWRAQHRWVTGMWIGAYEGEAGKCKWRAQELWKRVEDTRGIICPKTALKQCTRRSRLKTVQVKQFCHMIPHKLKTLKQKQKMDCLSFLRYHVIRVLQSRYMRWFLKTFIHKGSIMNQRWEYNWVMEEIALLGYRLFWFLILVFDILTDALFGPKPKPTVRYRSRKEYIILGESTVVFLYPAVKRLDPNIQNHYIANITSKAENDPPRLVLRFWADVCSSHIRWRESENLQCTDKWWFW